MLTPGASRQEASGSACSQKRSIKTPASDGMKRRRRRLIFQPCRPGRIQATEAATRTPNCGNMPKVILQVVVMNCPGEAVLCRCRGSVPRTPGVATDVPQILFFGSPNAVCRMRVSRSVAVLRFGGKACRPRRNEDGARRRTEKAE